MKFCICKHCGNIITFLHDAGAPEMCCGEEMTELIPGTVDAAVEKHIPVVTCSGNTVTVNVGSVAHPMIPAHFIQWVAMQTNQGSQIKYLKPDTAPTVTFALAEGEKVISVYEYCNLHGLWKADV